MPRDNGFLDNQSEIQRLKHHENTLTQQSKTIRHILNKIDDSFFATEAKLPATRTRANLFPESVVKGYSGRQDPVTGWEESKAGAVIMTNILNIPVGKEITETQRYIQSLKEKRADKIKDRIQERADMMEKMEVMRQQALYLARKKEAEAAADEFYQRHCRLRALRRLQMNADHQLRVAYAIIRSNLARQRKALFHILDILQRQQKSRIKGKLFAKRLAWRRVYDSIFQVLNAQRHSFIQQERAMRHHCLFGLRLAMRELADTKRERQLNVMKARAFYRRRQGNVFFKLLKLRCSAKHKFAVDKLAQFCARKLNKKQSSWFIQQITRKHTNTRNHPPVLTVRALRLQLLLEKWSLWHHLVFQKKRHIRMLQKAQQFYLMRGARQGLRMWQRWLRHRKETRELFSKRHRLHISRRSRIVLQTIWQNWRQRKRLRQQREDNVIRKVLVRLGPLLPGSTKSSKKLARSVHPNLTFTEGLDRLYLSRVWRRWCDKCSNRCQQSSFLKRSAPSYGKRVHHRLLRFFQLCRQRANRRRNLRTQLQSRLQVQRKKYTTAIVSALKKNVKRNKFLRAAQRLYKARLSATFLDRLHQACERRRKLQRVIRLSPRLRRTLRATFHYLRKWIVERQRQRRLIRSRRAQVYRCLQQKYLNHWQVHLHRVNGQWDLYESGKVHWAERSVRKHLRQWREVIESRRNKRQYPALQKLGSSSFDETVATAYDEEEDDKFDSLHKGETDHQQQQHLLRSNSAKELVRVRSAKTIDSKQVSQPSNNVDKAASQPYKSSIGGKSSVKQLVQPSSAVAAPEIMRSQLNVAANTSTIGLVAVENPPSTVMAKFHATKSQLQLKFSQLKSTQERGSMKQLKVLPDQPSLANIDGDTYAKEQKVDVDIVDDVEEHVSQVYTDRLEGSHYRSSSNLLATKSFRSVENNLTIKKVASKSAHDMSTLQSEAAEETRPEELTKKASLSRLIKAPSTVLRASSSASLPRASSVRVTSTNVDSENAPLQRKASAVGLARIASQDDVFSVMDSNTTLPVVLLRHYLRRWLRRTHEHLFYDVQQYNAGKMLWQEQLQRRYLRRWEEVVEEVYVERNRLEEFHRTIQIPLLKKRGISGLRRWIQHRNESRETMKMGCELAVRIAARHLLREWRQRAHFVAHDLQDIYVHGKQHHAHRYLRNAVLHWHINLAQRKLSHQQAQVGGRLHRIDHQLRPAMQCWWRYAQAQLVQRRARRTTKEYRQVIAFQRVHFVLSRLAERVRQMRSAAERAQVFYRNHRLRKLQFRCLAKLRYRTSYRRQRAQAEKFRQKQLVKWTFFKGLKVLWQEYHNTHAEGIARAKALYLRHQYQKTMSHWHTSAQFRHQQRLWMKKYFEHSRLHAGLLVQWRHNYLLANRKPQKRAMLSAKMAHNVKSYRRAIALWRAFLQRRRRVLRPMLLPATTRRGRVLSQSALESAVSSRAWLWNSEDQASLSMALQQQQTQIQAQLSQQPGRQSRGGQTPIGRVRSDSMNSVVSALSIVTTTPLPTQTVLTVTSSSALAVEFPIEVAWMRLRQRTSTRAVFTSLSHHRSLLRLWRQWRTQHVNRLRPASRSLNTAVHHHAHSLQTHGWMLWQEHLAAKRAYQQEEKRSMLHQDEWQSKTALRALQRNVVLWRRQQRHEEAMRLAHMRLFLDTWRVQTLRGDVFLAEVAVQVQKYNGDMPVVNVGSKTRKSGMKASTGPENTTLFVKRTAPKSVAQQSRKSHKKVVKDVSAMTNVDSTPTYAFTATLRLFYRRMLQRSRLSWQLSSRIYQQHRLQQCNHHQLLRSLRHTLQNWHVASHHRHQQMLQSTAMARRRLLHRLLDAFAARQQEAECARADDMFADQHQLVFHQKRTLLHLKRTAHLRRSLRKVRQSRLRNLWQLWSRIQMRRRKMKRVLHWMSNRAHFREIDAAFANWHQDTIVERRLAQFLSQVKREKLQEGFEALRYKLQQQSKRKRQLLKADHHFHYERRHRLYTQILDLLDRRYHQRDQIKFATRHHRLETQRIALTNMLALRRNRIAEVFRKKRAFQVLLVALRNQVKFMRYVREQNKIADCKVVRRGFGRLQQWTTLARQRKYQLGLLSSGARNKGKADSTIHYATYYWTMRQTLAVRRLFAKLQFKHQTEHFNLIMDEYYWRSKLFKGFHRLLREVRYRRRIRSNLFLHARYVTCLQLKRSLRIWDSQCLVKPWQQQVVLTQVVRHHRVRRLRKGLTALVGFMHRMRSKKERQRQEEHARLLQEAESSGSGAIARKMKRAARVRPIQERDGDEVVVMEDTLHANI